MTTTVSVRFPLGRVHATRWDGGANTSDVEWPPAPWRLLRALCAVWHTRWPDLAGETVEDVLSTLGTPTAYRTPPVRAGSTRHYMPDVLHRSGTRGRTDKVIDAFLAIDPTEPLLIQWASDMSDAQRGTLARLLELLPYLGRSESLCDAELLDHSPQPDSTWWRLGSVGPGSQTVQLLAPDGAVRLAQLEATTVAVRKARRLIPAGAQWVSYGQTQPAAAPSTRRATENRTTTCVRFDLAGVVPVRARSGVLAADAMHKLITRTLSDFGVDSTDLVGRSPDGSPRRALHDHLHVAVLSGASRAFYPANAPITSIVAWVPAGYRDVELKAIVRGLGGRALRYGRGRDKEHIPAQPLLFVGSGSPAQLLTEHSATSKEWVSAMPYLPVRHRKRHEDDDEFLLTDVTQECGYRGWVAPTSVTRVDDPSFLGEIAQYRRFRANENVARRRRGVFLRLSFNEPLAGPLFLGQLSHYGFGSFVPADEASRAGMTRADPTFAEGPDDRDLSEAQVN